MSEQPSVTNPIDPALGLVDDLTGLAIPPTPLPLGQTQPMRIYRIIATTPAPCWERSTAVRSRRDRRRQARRRSIRLHRARGPSGHLYEGPNLYLNANYEGTSVPVRKALGPLGVRVVLSQ